VTTRITFLGSGGGRFTTIYQVRATGGIYIETGINIHIDPGPGALVQMHRNGINPTKTDVLLISHGHTDHYTDAEVLIEGITNGGTKKKGILAGSKSVIEGYDDFEPIITSYHRGLVDKVVVMEPGKGFQHKGVKFSAFRCFHNDPTTVGFRIETRDGLISYIADTDFNEKLIRSTKGSRILIISTTRPLGAKIPNHLSTKEAARIIDEVRPELAVLTHFGLKMIEANPDFQADWVWKETGVRTIAADDGMSIEMGRRIEVT